MPALECRIQALEPRWCLEGQNILPPAGYALPTAIVLPASASPTLLRPTAIGSRPAHSASAVDVDTFVSIDVRLPNTGHGVDPATLTADSVMLRRLHDGTIVAAAVNTSAAGDSIVLTPHAALSPLSRYRLTVTDRVRDTAGAAFHEYTVEFTTGVVAPTGGLSNVRFTRQPQARTNGHAYTAVAFGPDGNLYAATRQGFVIRFSLDADGQIINSKTIKTVRGVFNGNRLITGIAFAPTASTRKPPVVYLTHGDGRLHDAPDFSSRISRLSGKHLNRYADLVTGLPRSSGDHLVNQLTFGADNRIYLSQASNSAMGAPDAAWSYRPERLLSAAVLQVDLAKIGSSPVHVQTENTSTPYDPFDADAPVTLYASGVRNAYDLVWTRDGKLFAPTNGSAAGGSTPQAKSPYHAGPRIDHVARGRYLGPSIAPLSGVSTQNDLLLRVERGRYYGHPNPSRAEYVLNGGNPTAGVDENEVAEYPVGTRPDRNYAKPALVLGRSYSPDGIIEYTGSSFGNAINGALLTVRYSGGDDVLVLPRDNKGNVTGQVSGLPGLRGFTDPVDLVQHPLSGALYVAEYGGRQITLVKPDEPPTAAPAAAPPRTTGNPFAGDRSILDELA